MKFANLALAVLFLAPLPTYAASDQEFSTMRIVGCDQTAFSSNAARQLQ